MNIIVYLTIILPIGTFVWIVTSSNEQLSENVLIVFNLYHNFFRFRVDGKGEVMSGISDFWQIIKRCQSVKSYTYFKFWK